ncbi:bacitracin ABC transporter ATP-binding protein, partial [Pseudomonas aeruginosa]
MTILEVNQLTKIYGNQHSSQEILHDINLSVDKG